MPGYVLIVDFFGVVLAVIGFTMAFCQPAFRRLIGRPQAPVSRVVSEDGGDPLTYILRIAGVMVMIFGIVLAGMFTLFNLA
ncbi:MAG: hypothetical protein WCY29_09860 [Novosphingobium sp.]